MCRIVRAVSLAAVILLCWVMDASATIRQEGYCSFYDECGNNPEITNSLITPIVPCVSNTPAKIISGGHLSKLKSVCPLLYVNETDTRVCCSFQQLLSIERSISISQGIINRCPSCSQNFANVYCQNTCSPNQSQFINVTRSFEANATANLFGVLSYQCYYQKSFADESFDSCKNVRLPATGGYAISTMCGKYGHQFCTSQRWLDFQGDTSNGFAPLDIDFKLIVSNASLGDGILPHYSKVWKCNESAGLDGGACTCQDCTEACSKIPAPPQEKEPFKIGELDGILVICLILFFILTLIFLGFLFVKCIHTCRQSEKKIKNLPPVKKEDITCTEKLSLSTHKFLGKMFRKWGTMVASYPKTVILLSTVIVIALSFGLIFIELTTDPVELWSAPNSRARQEKDFHDANFGPFFRTNQLIVTVANRSSYQHNSIFFGQQTFSGILNKDILLELLDLQIRLQNITVFSRKHNKTITLKDVCYAPLNPDNASSTDCCVNSLMQYFQNNKTRFDLKVQQTVSGQTGDVDWRDHFLYCVNSPLSFKDITDLQLSCMADYGAPVFPFLAVGGYKGKEFSESEALIITFSLNNFPRSDPRFEYVMLWEERFLEMVKAYQRDSNTKLAVAYMAERSLEDEISRTTVEDIPIFVISYAVIFLYIALALGEYTRCSRVLVESKVTLGLGGIMVVLGSVLSAMGIYCYLGIPSSLIIVEVVPFLVLAVGADNIFIFVLEYQRHARNPKETREEHIGRVLGIVAPSMLLCSLSESICFYLGALTPMPAVKTFALNAALAVLLDFLLQMSMFVALVSLDVGREEDNRFDICCCIQMKKKKQKRKHKGFLYSFMKNVYAPILLNSFIRIFVMLSFIFMFCAGIFFATKVRVGLDQELSVPKDSYMLNYFGNLSKYFEVGVPTYFVTKGYYNFSSLDGINGICSSVGCDNNSMTQKIQYATQFPNESYLAIPASSWVDDFMDWLNPTSSCCRLHFLGPNKGEFCPSTSTSLTCLQKCMKVSNGIVRPTVDQFNKYLPLFLSDPPNLKCPKGGLGAYDGAVKLSSISGNSSSSNNSILATRFMAYHIPLKTSQEYTGALRVARELSDNITKSMRRVPGTDPDFTVFPYTITYVYYEQYLTVVFEGLFNIAVCLLPTFVVCCLLLGMDIRSGFINLLTIIMIVVDTVGVMTIWGIDYNAVSLINLVTAVGMSVEFVSHLTRSFAISVKTTKVARAKEATATMGSAVFAGVAMTNLPGIIVLAFANAQLIQIFFFRLNLTITLLGMLHGLVFLPVALSYFGPDINRAVLLEQEEDQERLRKATENCSHDGKLSNQSGLDNNGFQRETKANNGHVQVS